MPNQINTDTFDLGAIEAPVYSLRTEAKAAWKAMIDADYQAFAAVFNEDSNTHKLLRRRVANMNTHDWRVPVIHEKYGVLISGRRHYGPEGPFSVQFMPIDSYFSFDVQQDDTWSSLMKRFEARLEQS